MDNQSLNDSQRKINWRMVIIQIFIIFITVVSTLVVSYFIYQTNSKNENKLTADQNSKNSSIEDSKKSQSVKVGEEVSQRKANFIIDFGKDGKSLKTESDINSLETSGNIKEFLKKEVREANVWNEKVDKEFGGNGIKYDPKIYKIYGDYFVYFSGHDTGAGSRIWGSALGGEKVEDQNGVRYLKQGEITGLYGLYTKCSDILKYKIPYELFADYKVSGGMELTTEKCSAAEKLK